MVERSAQEWERLGAASFVSLGTVRKNGEIVRTPVWIAAQGAALVLTTEISTGKVRRLRHDPRVVMRVCDRMGKLDEDAPDVEGVGVLVQDEQKTSEATRRLRGKYGLQFAAFLAVERVVRKIQRRPPGRVIVAITRPE